MLPPWRPSTPCWMPASSLRRTPPSTLPHWPPPRTTRERLGALLAALPDRDRIPVVLRHVDDLSYAELSLVLGRPEGTLKAEVHRGLAMLRAEAARTGFEEMTA